MKQDKIRKLKVKFFEIIKSQEQIEKKMKKNKESLRNWWENIKHINMHIMGVPRGEEKERAESLFEEIMAAAVQ